MLSNDTKATTCAIATFTKLYVPVIPLPIQVNAKILQQLKSGFKRNINRNKYQSKILAEAPNPYLDYLILRE